MSQAHGMSGQVMYQLQNMLEHVNIELQTRMAQEQVKSEREKLIAAGKNPDSSFEIG
jgi:hypothetical protein